MSSDTGGGALDLFPALERLEAPPAPRGSEVPTPLVEPRGLLSCASCGLSSYIGTLGALRARAESGPCPSCLGPAAGLTVRGVVS